MFNIRKLIGLAASCGQYLLDACLGAMASIDEAPNTTEWDTTERHYGGPHLQLTHTDDYWQGLARHEANLLACPPIEPGLDGINMKPLDEPGNLQRTVTSMEQHELEGDAEYRDRVDCVGGTRRPSEAGPCSCLFCIIADYDGSCELKARIEEHHYSDTDDEWCGCWECVSDADILGEAGGDQELADIIRSIRHDLPCWRNDAGCECGACPGDAGMADGDKRLAAMIIAGRNKNCPWWRYEAGKDDMESDDDIVCDCEACLSDGAVLYMAGGHKELAARMRSERAGQPCWREYYAEQTKAAAERWAQHTGENHSPECETGGACGWCDF